MSDGNKAWVCWKVDGEVIEQKIVRLDDGYVWVSSSKGNEYPVKLSDKVALTMSFDVGDVAVIKCFKSGWLVFDIVRQDEVDEFTLLYRKKINGTASNEELERFEWLKENDEDLQKELEEFDDLLGGY